jgi:hypothetical protein
MRLEMQLNTSVRFLFLAQAVTTCHHRDSMQRLSPALPVSLRSRRREAVSFYVISGRILVRPQASLQ